MAKDCTALKKFRIFPINANPSTPIKIAIALEVTIPANILVIIVAEFKWATLNKTFAFM